MRLQQVSYSVVSFLLTQIHVNYLGAKVRAKTFFKRKFTHNEVVWGTLLFIVLVYLAKNWASDSK